MITQKYIYSLNCPKILNKYADISKILFFDIETTGLSAKSSFVYLISYGYCINNQFHLISLLAENISEEKHILEQFADICKSFSVIISYNGEHFDIPYLQTRYSFNKHTSTISEMNSLDLYLYIKNYKNIMNLPNCRLKTIEKYLDINREDTIDGGEAINEYYNYQRFNDIDSLNLCLLHNKEDVFNLINICPLLVLDYIRKENLQLSYIINDNQFVITSDLPADSCIHIEYSFDDIKLLIDNNKAKLFIKISEGKIKVHYKNYRNYHYLEKEGYAVDSSYIKIFKIHDVKRADIYTAYRYSDISVINENSLSELWHQNIEWLIKASYLKRDFN